MRRKVLEVCGVVIAMMGLALGMTWAAETQPEPAKTQVEVTYYYLPG